MWWSSYSYSPSRVSNAHGGGTGEYNSFRHFTLARALHVAKMSLHEHVCGEDVDAAISILVTSFINAQKFSVRSSLERGFRKFLISASDFFDLLLYALRSLVREAQTYMTLRANQRGVHLLDLELKVPIDDFEAKVREFNYVGDLDEYPFRVNFSRYLRG